MIKFHNLVFQFYDGYVKSVRPINVRRLLASDSEFVKDCKEQQTLLVPTSSFLSSIFPQPQQNTNFCKSGGTAAADVGDQWRLRSLGQSQATALSCQGFNCVPFDLIVGGSAAEFLLEKNSLLSSGLVTGAAGKSRRFRRTFKGGQQ